MYNKDISCFSQDGFVNIVHCTANTISAPLWDWRLFGRSLKEISGSRQNPDDPHGISSFQAFVTGLASRVGTGNIAGVAIAISMGGAGAVFWMWLVALIGMASAFAESSLAQLYKVRDKKTGLFRGGPAYYIAHGLNLHWLSVLFSVSLIVCFGFVYQSIQANTIVQAVQSAANMTAEDGVSAEVWNTYKHAIGAVLVLLAAPIIFGGVRRVAKVAEGVVPLMSVIYLLVALYVMIVNAGEIPRVLGLIFQDAFSSKAVGGGLLGGIVSQAMMYGIKRGLYSDEAGQGSAPNAAAAADVKHPVSQGLIQMLGVFIDTIVVCSCTAFIILLSNVPMNTELSGIQLTQAALESQIGGWAQQFLAVVLFLFAFTTIIGNYAYAESNVKFIKSHWLILSLFRMGVLGMVYFGAVNSVPLVWDMADMAMGTMAWINLIAILLLSPLVFLLLKDYTAKLKMGKDPQFKLSEHPGLKRKIKSDIW